MSAETALLATLAEEWPTAPWTLNTYRKLPNKNLKHKKSDNKALQLSREPKKQLSLHGRKQPEKSKSLLDKDRHF
mgnify:CR=1 FL=1